MNRDKQIEEIAIDLCEYYNCDGTCYQDDKPCDLRCDEYTNARYLYEKGYRKASDVAREIFEEIEDVLNNIGYFDELDFEALKKKFTEDE